MNELRMVSKKYSGGLFNPSKVKNEIVHKPKIDENILIQIQAEIWIKQFGTSCFNADQLSQILGVGASNVYEQLKKPDFPVKIIGKRKVVSAVALAAWMLEQNSVQK